MFRVRVQRPPKKTGFRTKMLTKTAFRPAGRSAQGGERFNGPSTPFSLVILAPKKGVPIK